VKKGRKSAREITRARILLLAKGDTEIAEILEVGRNTVWRTKKRRTMKDFARFVKMLVDGYPNVEVIRIGIKL
jgi:hypothetical protein